MKSIRTEPRNHAAEGDERTLMVTGSREKYWRDHVEVKRGILQRLKTFPADTVVLQGEADGVDTWAKEACEILGLDFVPYPPDDSIPSPQRFHIRNDQMLDRADEVLAVWDGKSRGTKSVIDKAEKRGLRTWIWIPE